MQYSLLAVFFVSTGAFAGDKLPPYFCTPAAAAAASARKCADNRVLIDALTACREKLARVQKQVSEAVTAGFSKDLIAAQTAKFGSANQDYGASAQGFDYLASLANIAEADLKGYPSEVMVPAGFLTVSTDDPDAWAMSKPCYGETQNYVKDTQTFFHEKSAEFIAKRDKSRSLAGISKSNGADESSIGAGTVRGGVGTGAAVPSGTSRNGSSSITGVEEDRKKNGH